MKHRAVAVAVALLLAGCAVSRASTDEPSTADVAVTAAPDQPTDAPVATEPPIEPPISAGAPAAGPDDTVPAGTAPDVTAASTVPSPGASTAPPTSGTDTVPSATVPPDAPVSPQVAAAVPTAGTTVVHVGWDLSGVWTPLAIWDGAAWHPAEQSADVPASTFGEVSVVGLRPLANGLTYRGADAVCIDDRRGPLLAFDGDSRELPGGDGYRAVGVAANWEVQPRPVSESGVDSFQYQEIGESIVAAAGVDPTGGDVVQVVRADLDGDGMQEVFVRFEKITDGGGAPGDFVVIYGRFPKPTGTVTDTVLFEYYPEAWTSHPTIGRAELLAIGDFNGDAIMEVVLSSRFWDSTLAELLVFDGGTSLRSVGATGCSL